MKHTSLFSTNFCPTPSTTDIHNLYCSKYELKFNLIVPFQKGKYFSYEAKGRSQTITLLPTQPKTISSHSASQGKLKCKTQLFTVVSLANTVLEALWTQLCGIYRYSEDLGYEEKMHCQVARDTSHHSTYRALGHGFLSC